MPHPAVCSRTEAESGGSRDAGPRLGWGGHAGLRARVVSPVELWGVSPAGRGRRDEQAWGGSCGACALSGSRQPLQVFPGCQGQSRRLPAGLLPGQRYCSHLSPGPSYMVKCCLLSAGFFISSREFRYLTCFSALRLGYLIIYLF